MDTTKSVEETVNSQPLIGNQTNNNNNNNNNISNHDSSRMKYLFLKVFRSLVIKRIINYHLKLYNQYQYHMVPFYSRNGLISFKYGSYLQFLNYWSNDKLQVGDIIIESVHTVAFGNVNGKSYDHPLEKNLFPQSVTSIDMGAHFNKPIEPGTFSESVKRLSLYPSFNQVLNSSNLPSSIEILRVSKKCFNNLRSNYTSDFSTLLELANLKCIQVINDLDITKVTLTENYYINDGIKKFNGVHLSKFVETGTDYFYDMWPYILKF